MTDRSELDRQLDRGNMGELPPNIPPGFLGEIGPDFRKVDEFEPSLNAGVIQEQTWETRWLTIVLLYLLVVTSPVAVWLLWRDRKLGLRTKVVTTAIGVVIYAAVWVFTTH